MHSKIRENETPLLSVIIPVYNTEKYLERCISSVVTQSYKNLEIFLVDDGSTDRSSEICDNWAERDSRIHVCHKINEGPGAARNIGIKMSEGGTSHLLTVMTGLSLTCMKKC